MSIPDLSHLSSTELTELINTAKNLIEKKKADEINALKTQMEELAAQSGLSLDEVLGTSKSSSTKKTKVAPKYQNPDDASMTWTGRGRQPKWFEAALASGMTREQLEI